jgi:hypothetical protein
VLTAAIPSHGVPTTVTPPPTGADKALIFGVCEVPGGRGSAIRVLADVAKAWRIRLECQQRPLTNWRNGEPHKDPEARRITELAFRLFEQSGDQQ